VNDRFAAPSAFFYPIWSGSPLFPPPFWANRSARGRRGWPPSAPTLIKTNTNPQPTPPSSPETAPPPPPHPTTPPTHHAPSIEFLHAALSQELVFNCRVTPCRNGGNSSFPTPLLKTHEPSACKKFRPHSLTDVGSSKEEDLFSFRWPPPRLPLALGLCCKLDKSSPAFIHIRYLVGRF